MSERETKIYDLDFKKADYQPLMLFSIFDTKVKKFMPPFFCSCIDDAIRQVKNIVNYSNSLINKFPNDYCLYKVGTFDENLGYITPVDISDNFVSFLSDYVTDDTIKYDELKKEVKSQQFSITGALKEFDEKVALYEKKLRELQILEDKIKSKYECSVDLPPIPDKKKLVLNKKCKLLDKLFS